MRRNGQCRRVMTKSGAHAGRACSPSGAGQGRSTPSGFAQPGVELVEIGLNLLAAALVDELPPPHASCVGQAHACRGQLALDVVDSFAEHDLYPIGALAVDHDVQGLPGFRYAYLYFLRVHRHYAFGSARSFSKRWSGHSQIAATSTYRPHAIHGCTKANGSAAT